jgi:hypothetical protein
MFWWQYLVLAFATAVVCRAVWVAHKEEEYDDWR